MGEPKPLASLSAGLLARKGAARPAMRRQPLGSGPAPVAGVPGYDDLGWNDMGYDVDPERTTEAVRMVDLKPLLAGSVLPHDEPVEQPVEEAVAVEEIAAPVPEVVRQQESLHDRVAAVAREVAKRPAPKAKAPVKAPRARDKAAFTLRLDAERHLRLRLASAVTNRSAQIILTELLDDYLASLPEIDAMANRVPAAPARRAARS